jgi:hypothetical protein
VRVDDVALPPRSADSKRAATAEPELARSRNDY